MSDKKTDDYKQTIREAAELDGDGPPDAEEKTDIDIAYAAIAVASAMNTFGMGQGTVNLLQLELARDFAEQQKREEHDDGQD